MKFIGSKARYAKYILPHVLKDRTEDQWYVEPFVGGFNIMDKVGGKRVGNDKHHYLIALFRAIRNGWNPPTTVTETTYMYVKNHKDKLPAYMVGFVGFGCSYSGKWFGGYARGGTRNYAEESARNLLKQAPKLQGVTISCVDYKHMYVPMHSIVYCDPPYSKTTGYVHAIDHTDFWAWCEHLIVERKCSVFVSEYHAPSQYPKLWSKQVFNTLDKNTGSKRGIENLYRIVA